MSEITEGKPVPFKPVGGTAVCAEATLDDGRVVRVKMNLHFTSIEDMKCLDTEGMPVVRAKVASWVSVEEIP